MEFYSDREVGSPPRKCEGVSERVWRGICSLFKDLTRDPGYDPTRFWNGARARIPGLGWESGLADLEDVPVMLDFIEFAFAGMSIDSVHATPTRGCFHEDCSAVFRSEVNILFRRNGIAYELGADGQVRRLAPAPLDGLLARRFKSGDQTLDDTLRRAVDRFLTPDPASRMDGVKDLWDAWERLKTLEPGAGKKVQADALLDRVAPGSSFRDLLSIEAAKLTEIGNSFQIRHSETDKASLEKSEHADYLFYRLFALIDLCLRLTGRAR